MTRVVRLAALAAAALVCIASTAHAGGYVALGFGGANLRGDLDDHFGSSGHAAGRLVAGHRTGPLAIEAGLFGADLTGTSQLTGAGTTFEGPDYSTLSLGIDVKGHIPIAMALELYARLGINKTWLSTPDVDGLDLGYTGRGYNYGLGVQYTFRPLPLIDAAVWLDFNRQKLTLKDSGLPDIEGGIDMITVGVTIGAGL